MPEDFEKNESELVNAEQKFQKELDSRMASKKKYSENSKKWKLILICIGIVALILIIINSFHEMHELHNPSRPIELELEDAKITMFMVSIKLEEYRKANACYPDSLGPGMDIYDTDYILHSDGSYSLSCQLVDTTVTFSSTENPGDLISEDFMHKVIGGGVN